jgi:drug/metabolite transporter (DMT)-like permease
VLLLPFSLPELRSQDWSAVPAASWTGLAFAALIGAAAAYVLWYEGVQRIGPTRTISYHYLVPFIAVLTSALVLGDPVRPLTVLGGIAILGGVAIVQLRQRSRT